MDTSRLPRLSATTAALNNGNEFLCDLALDGGNMKTTDAMSVNRGLEEATTTTYSKSPRLEFYFPPFFFVSPKYTL